MKEAAAGSPVASFSSFTSCQELKASRKLMKPGLPFSTRMGRSLPSFMKMRDGFWFGLQPYLSSSSFIGLLSMGFLTRRGAGCGAPHPAKLSRS